jgi:hypothetical protein
LDPRVKAGRVARISPSLAAHTTRTATARIQRHTKARRGPIPTPRGIDSLTYYQVDTSQYVQLINYSGCGHTVSANHPIVKQLIIDSLVGAWRPADPKLGLEMPPQPGALGHRRRTSPQPLPTQLQPAPCMSVPLPSRFIGWRSTTSTASASTWPAAFAAVSALTRPRLARSLSAFAAPHHAFTGRAAEHPVRARQATARTILWRPPHTPSARNRNRFQGQPHVRPAAHPRHCQAPRAFQKAPHRGALGPGHVPGVGGLGEGVSGAGYNAVHSCRRALVRKLVRTCASPAASRTAALGAAHPDPRRMPPTPRFEPARQVGSFPNWDVWAEWNGKYRDDVRRFIKGDPGGWAGQRFTRGPFGRQPSANGTSRSWEVAGWAPSNSKLKPATLTTPLQA